VQVKFFNARRSDFGKTNNFKTGENGNIQSIAYSENK
jgi:hypothetical protein